MGGDVETIKGRLDVAEVIGGYVKLEKAGKSLKARCPFHSEKTPSFYVSPLRQSYYCFGCGAKGDIFTFVQEIEGVSFREALKSLGDKAGVELKGTSSLVARSEKEKLRQALEVAMQFFEKELKASEEAKKYLAGRGIEEHSISSWHLGLAKAEWRSLYNHLLTLGFNKEILLKAGLVKPVTGNAKEPYDVFRDRIIFPLLDANGEVVGFSGRALSKDTEPKYLNSPDTVLFTKSELLYGLDIAKSEIRKKNFAVLVEGQIDLVLSHQAGVANTVASSGTAFTQAHLERLRRLSPRIILAFDGDKAGRAAAEKATDLALSLGLEVKVAKLPEGKDPADLAKEDPNKWKEVLRQAKPAIEHFLELLLEAEKDRRKLGKLIEARLLPKVALLSSSMERSHFISLIARKTDIKEEMIWEDLRSVNVGATRIGSRETVRAALPNNEKTHKDMIEERLTEVRAWLKEVGDSELKKEEAELVNNLKHEEFKAELLELNRRLSQAESSKDEKEVARVAKRIQGVLKGIRTLEDVV